MPFAAVAVAGLGLSAASAAGAFGGKVDKWAPTPQEMEAAKWATNTFNLGRRIQNPLDASSRQDLKYLESPEAMDQGQGLAVSNVASQLYPAQEANLQKVAASSGGPGSGRWWGSLWDSQSEINKGLTGAAVQGRLGALNNYVSRTGQFLDRRTTDLNSGLAGMTSGGQQAADAQANRIQAQLASKIAANQSMGQMGGALMSVGMAGMGGFGGSGGSSGSAKPSGGK